MSGKAPAHEDIASNRDSVAGKGASVWIVEAAIGAIQIAAYGGASERDFAFCPEALVKEYAASNFCPACVQCDTPPFSAAELDAMAFEASADISVDQVYSAADEALVQIQAPCNPCALRVNIANAASVKPHRAGAGVAKDQGFFEKAVCQEQRALNFAAVKIEFALDAGAGKLEAFLVDEGPAVPFEN